MTREEKLDELIKLEKDRLIVDAIEKIEAEKKVVDDCPECGRYSNDMQGGYNLGLDKATEILKGTNGTKLKVTKITKGEPV